MSGAGIARGGALLTAFAGVLAGAALLPGPDVQRAATPGLRVTVLDVGEGSATLLEPADGAAILVDAGPPQADVAGQLEALGVQRLGAMAISHPQLDHEGGAADVLARIATERLAFARIGPSTLGAARLAGAEPLRLYEGDRIRSGSLRLEALWPDRRVATADSARAGDPNLLSLVLLVHWHGFELLLPGDAEAESVPLDPGPLDVLEVSHHGSEDAGLGRLLDRSEPRMAVISVGDDNAYGHPAATTVEELAAHGVSTLRTDQNGPVTIEVDRDGRVFVPR